MSEGGEASAEDGGELGGEALYFRVELAEGGVGEALAEGGGGIGLVGTEVSSAVPSPPPIELERDEVREPREELRRRRRSMASFTGTGLARQSVTGSMSLEVVWRVMWREGDEVVGWMSGWRWVWLRTSAGERG